MVTVPAVPSKTAVESPHRVEVGTSFVYAYGMRSTFGGLVEGTYGWRAWETGRAEGTLDLGLMLGYQAAPLSNPYLGSGSISGAAHQLEALVVAGHTLRMPPSRRLVLSLQLFAGWTHLLMRGALKNPSVGVAQGYAADAGEFTYGVLLQLGFRVSDRVSIVTKMIGPIPNGCLSVKPYFMTSLGLSVRLP